MTDKKKERTVLFLDPDLKEEYEALAKLDERELGEILRLALRLAKPLVKRRIELAEAFIEQALDESMPGKPAAA